MTLLSLGAIYWSVLNAPRRTPSHPAQRKGTPDRSSDTLRGFTQAGKLSSANSSFLSRFVMAWRMTLQLHSTFDPFSLKIHESPRSTLKPSIGRTACGLPVDQPEFATLPPHFTTLNTHVVNAVKSAFPTLHKFALSVAQFCLASLLYHDAFLENTLPPSHPLRHSRYYKAEQRKRELAQFVSCESSNSDNILRPTGVPPYVNMQVMMPIMAQELRELTTAIRTVPDELVARTQARVGDDTTNLRSTMTEVLRENGMFDAIARINAVAPMGRPAAPTNAADDQIQQRPHRTIYDALMRQRPRFQLPTGTILGAWQCWFGGDNPLRFATG